MKRKFLKSISLGFLSLGLCAVDPAPVSIDPADYDEYSTNVTGNDIALYDGTSFLYNTSITQSLVFNYAPGPSEPNTCNINFIFNNFSLRTLAEDDYAFHIRNLSKNTINITFYLNGDSEIISGNTALPPIYLYGDGGNGEDSGNINLFFTLVDTSCDKSASLTLGIGYAVQDSVPVIERDGCGGEDKLIDVRETSSGTENLLNVPANPTMYYLFNGWVHNYTEQDVVETIESTCSYAGHKDYLCPRCSNHVIVELPLAEHVFDENAYIEHTEPDCVSGGYLLKQCSVCEELVEIEMEEPPLGHDYELDTANSIAPTCQEDGVNWYECTRCEDRYSEEVPQLTEHDWVLDGVTEEPTCGGPGYGTYYCSMCGDLKEDVIPNDGYEHTWGDWEVTQQPDCSTQTPGSKTRTCIECGETETEEIAPQHALRETPIKEGTCISEEKVAMQCVICGYYDESRVMDSGLNPENHEGELVFVVDTPSTETTEGVGHYEWTCCHAHLLNENDVEVIVTICKEGEHEWILNDDAIITEPTCGREGYGTYFCNICGLTKEAVIPNEDYEHTWGDWEITSQPDCKTQKDGSQKRTCLVCGEVETETIYFEHIWDRKTLTEPTCITRGSWTMACTVCGYYDPREVEYEDYNQNNHEGVKKLVVDVAATTESEGKGHYEWTCCGAMELDERENIIYVTIPKLSKDTSKDVLSDIIIGQDQAGEKPTENIQATDALESASDETLLDIAVVVNQAFDTVANLSENTTTEEERQAYVESIQAATESAVIAGAKLDNSAEEALSITINLPERALPNLEKVLKNFYSIQYDTILGRRNSQSQSAPFRGVTITGYIDYEVEAEKYRMAVDCINTTVDHMASAAGMIRVCSNEKISTLVNEYIEQIGVRSFRDFNKEEADLEFAAKAYEAILVNMQTQTITNLKNSYDELSKTMKGTELDALKEEYEIQLAACNDISQFEWIVIEIMRQKYNSVLSEQLDKKIITYDEYKAKFIPEGEANLVKFKDIYKAIFYKWALGDDAVNYGYTEDYGITLQELTDATIDSVVLREKPKEIAKGATSAEITVAVVFGTLCLLTAGALVTLEVLKKKKGVVAA